MAAPAEPGHLLPKHHGEWTVDDVLALSEDQTTGQRVELLDGTLLVSPAPSSAHQRILQELQFGFRGKLPPGTELLPGVNLRLAGSRLLIPDFVVVTCPSVDTVYYDGSETLLAGEIESPSTKVFDRTLKRQLYAEAGVPFYLLVDPVKKPVEAVLFELVDGAYVAVSKSESGRIEITGPFGVTLDLAG
jgi:Uma2 family endonuclease